MSAPEKMERLTLDKRGVIVPHRYGTYVLHSAALARENALLEALKECRIALVTDNEYPEDSLSVMRIDNVIRQIEETR